MVTIYLNKLGSALILPYKKYFYNYNTKINSNQYMMICCKQD